MRYLSKIFTVGFIFFLSSCSVFELEENLNNPNEVGVDNLDVNLLMNSLQLEFADFVAEANTPGLELSRMMALTNGDTYDRAYQAQAHNDIWERAYQDVLVQANLLITKTDEQELFVHSGAARIMQAYTLITLVDMFGDVPYSEAIGGNVNFNPKADPGKNVYDAALALLDVAIADLAKTAKAPLARDIYYGGSAANWTALANSLKLKAYMNLRLTDASVRSKIESLLTANLIDTDAEEFTYKYGIADIPARSRHPQYRDMYKPQAGDADTYIGNYFMLAAYKQKGVEDPRWRYYLNRQVGSIAKALSDDPESIPCTISPRPSHYAAGQAWCAFDPGFFGRDHGNADGVPPDTRAKTTVGVYPCGGASDTNNGVADFQKVTQQGQGANGAGIQPIWMANFTEFLKAEAALMMGTPGDPKAILIGAVTKSIDRVRAFAAAKGQALPAGLEPSVTAYTDAVSAAYDAAASNDAKFDVMMKEYYLALWGNGIEAYNLYRRTGKPDDMQPMRAASPGNFVRSLIYPASFVNLNSSAVQKTLGGTAKVFWDNNPDDFCY